MGRKKELRRQQNEHVEQVFRDAQRLYQHLVAGGQLSGAKGDPRLADGEELILGGIYNVGRFRSAHVSYTVPGYFAVGQPTFVFGAMLGNFAARQSAHRNAEREAAPQWRFYGLHPCLLTGSRVLFFLDGRWEWERISALDDIYPNLAAHSLDIFYGGEPIRLVGPTAPWQSVAMLYLKYGYAGLQHPALQGLSGYKGER